MIDWRLVFRGSLPAIILAVGAVAVALAAQVEPKPAPAPPPKPPPASAIEAAGRWSSEDYAKGPGGKGGRIQFGVISGAYFVGRIKDQGAGWVQIQTWDGGLVWLQTQHIVTITPSPF